MKVSTGGLAFHLKPPHNIHSFAYFLALILTDLC